MKSIRLSNNTYVHVFLHHINVSLEEAVISSETWEFPDFKKMANDYIDALEDHDCVAFLEHLHIAAAQRIVRHWEEFAPNQLDEERNKQYLKFMECTEE
jgi:hypothetical protein